MTLVTLVMISLSSSRRKRLTVLVFSALFFGLIGFMMVPKTTVFVDTVRFFNTLDETRTFAVTDKAEAWHYLMNVRGYNSVPVIGLIIFLISLQPENGWLTFLAATVDVGAGLYICFKQSNNGKNKKTLVLCVFLFLSLFNFNAGVTGIRNYMAGFAAICIVYKFSDEFNAITLPFFLLLILIHPFVSIVLLIYLFAGMYRRHNFIYAICCALLLLQHYIQASVFNIFSKLSYIPFFASLSYKSTQYFGDGAYITVSSSFSRVRSILLFCFYFFILVYGIRRKVNLPKRYIGFAIMMGCFTLGAFMDQALFSRCTSMLMLSVLPFICEIVKKNIDRATALPIPLSISAAVALIVFADNLRAGIRFEDIHMSWYSLCILIVLILSMIVFLNLEGHKEHQR